MLAKVAHEVLVSRADYLEGELQGVTKHEYVAGVVYAMAGAQSVHNDIAGNSFAALHARLRGKPCRPYNSDTKVRVRLPNELRFYYPDVQVACHPNSPDQSFQDHPAIVFEVISESTRRTDEGEKREGYLALPSLENYLLVDTKSALVVGFRRTQQGFVREVYAGLDTVLALDAIDIQVPLREFYEGVAGGAR